MAGFASIVSIAGTLVSAVGTIASGQQAAQQAEYQAQQLDIRAKEEMAAGQRDAMEHARQKRLVLSRQQAVAASSGFGATDPTVLAIMGDTAAYGSMQEKMDLYGGISRSEGSKAQAAGARASGQAAVTASYFRAGSTILGGFTSMFDKYGKGFMPSAGGGVNPYGAASGWYG